MPAKAAKSKTKVVKKVASSVKRKPKVAAPWGFKQYGIVALVLVFLGGGIYYAKTLLSPSDVMLVEGVNKGYTPIAIWEFEQGNGLPIEDWQFAEASVQDGKVAPSKELREGAVMTSEKAATYLKAQSGEGAYVVEIRSKIEPTSSVTAFKPEVRQTALAGTASMRTAVKPQASATVQNREVRNFELTRGKIRAPRKEEFELVLTTKNGEVKQNFAMYVGWPDFTSYFVVIPYQQISSEVTKVSVMLKNRPAGQNRMWIDSVALYHQQATVGVLPPRSPMPVVSKRPVPTPRPSSQVSPKPMPSPIANEAVKIRGVVEVGGYVGSSLYVLRTADGAIYNLDIMVANDSKQNAGGREISMRQEQGPIDYEAIVGKMVEVSGIVQTQGIYAKFPTLSVLGLQLLETI